MNGLGKVCMRAGADVQRGVLVSFPPKKHGAPLCSDDCASQQVNIRSTMHRLSR